MAGFFICRDRGSALGRGMIYARYPSLLADFVCQSSCENLRLASVAGLYLSTPVVHWWSAYLSPMLSQNGNLVDAGRA